MSQLPEARLAKRTLLPSGERLVSHSVPGWDVSFVNVALLGNGIASTDREPNCRRYMNANTAEIAARPISPATARDRRRPGAGWACSTAVTRLEVRPECRLRIK